MSNDLASQQLTMQNNQMDQLEPKLDSSIRMGFMGLGTSSLQQMTMSNMGVGPGYDASASQQMSVSNMQMGMLQPVSNNLGLQMLANQQTGQMELQNFPQQYFLPNKHLGEPGTMLNNVALQQVSSLNKRKAPTELSVLQKAWMSNKRVAQVEHRPWLQPAPEKRSVQQLQFMSNSPGSQLPQASNKKVVQKESVTSKSGPQKQAMAKSQHAHIQSSKKVQTEPFESVRSKMRENLAAALALVSQDKSPNAGKSSQSEAASSPEKTQGVSQSDGSVSAASDAVAPLSEESRETLSSNNSAAMCLDGQSSSQLKFSNGNLSADTQATKCNVQDFQYGNLLPDDDVSFSHNFFARDELLQGNGLSWVLEPKIEVAEEKETPTVEKPEMGNEKVCADGDSREQKSEQCPQILASKIEAELFKLFGGVNKKYKEKGRSLLFNLKDRNNPELRERVVSGEIPPERLCSMSAEELASKELSQWRMAKAEELAQMVVLPDSEVDIRRLVRKTHKGEFQVEVEQVDAASADLSVGVNSLSQTLEKVNETEASPPSKPARVKEESSAAGAEKKSNVEDQDGPCTITIPSSEGSDLMQGLIVENELKDSDLPPIVSLDEFMESLDSEPPFGNLPGDAEKSTPISDKDDSEVGSESKSPVQMTRVPADATPAKHDKVDITDTKSDADVKRSDSPVKSETAASVASKGEVVWDGLLQFNISSMASVMGIFKSGEKTTGKEWASFLEIKGRVKLDAFEKYLQELPMSRSRAVMILQFVGKDKEASPKSDSRSLSEVAESYALDGRVGIAEPGPGVELYFCPPRSKSIELLSKILPEDQLEAFNAIDNGLIGVVVWKKAQLTSTTSPNSVSHHKHASKKHLTSTPSSSSSRRHHDKDHTTNMNLSISPRPSMPHNRPPVHAKPHLADDGGGDDDDDDVPPGFGPGVTQDDDDLPEFNFSGSSTHNPPRPPVTPFHPPTQTPSRPVDQIRELIHKYGQTQSIASSDRRTIGVATQPWNDDDDDIPEWQPQAPQQPVHGYQRTHMINQHHVGLMQQPHQQFRQTAAPLQPQLNAMQPQQQNSWTQGHGTYMAPPSQAGGVQYYRQPGVAWRQDAPKSRGF